MRNSIVISSGDKKSFAIHSSLLERFPGTGGLALGSFVIFINGHHFGKLEEDATLLGCSLDGVRRRVKMAGMHVPAFDGFSDASEIAEAYVESIHRDEGRCDYFGMDVEEFLNELYGKDLILAPDGDQAFDDGSVVLQFDLGEGVRIISFKLSEDDRCLFFGLEEIFLPKEYFYDVLIDWIARFENALQKP